MALILNIETATTVCSVSIFRENQLLAFKEIDAGYTHAENLHVFIGEVLKDSSNTFEQIDAVAVSKGPGSYTGLRIGVSAAKGLSFALKIPLIAIDTLQIMTEAARKVSENCRHYCPMLDARRMEVYTGVYDRNGTAVEPVQALIIDEHSTRVFSKYDDICFFGDGMPKSRDILREKGYVLFLENMKPSAKNMGALSQAKFEKLQFEDLAYIEPFYLKDFLAGKPKSR